MTIFVVLLRAVNVGGTGTLPMAAFRAACEEAGLRNVSTYIASGNMVCSSTESPTTLRDDVLRVVRDRFGLLKNEPIVRTAEEWAEVVVRNPFANAVSERPKFLHVHFFHQPPSADAISGLTRLAGTERLHLDGRQLYVDYAAGIGRSKLTPAVLDRWVRLPWTARNWNTIQTLSAMAHAVRDESR